MMRSNTSPSEDPVELLVPKLAERYRKAKIRIQFVEFTFHNICGLHGFVTGSRAEGPHSIDADTDFMFVSSDLLAAFSPDETETNLKEKAKVEVVISTEGRHPGYATLQVPSRTCRRVEDTVELTEDTEETLKSLCVVHRDGHLVLSSTKVLHSWTDLAFKLLPDLGILKRKDLHGPCIQPTFSHSGGQFELDYLYCLPCTRWPEAAGHWSSRTKKGHWPSEELTRKILQQGTFMVPIGFTLSTDKDVEWRFSFSLAERELVWNFDGNQTLCFDLLKAIHRVMKTRFPGALESYVWKTSLLWIVENTSHAEAQEPEQPVQLALGCIRWVLKAVSERNCPNYFIPENNMFDGKLTSDNLGDAVSFLEAISHSHHPLWNELVTRRLADFRDDMLFKHHILLNTLAVCQHFMLATTTDKRADCALAKLDSYIGYLKKQAARESSHKDLVSAMLGRIATHKGLLLYAISLEKNKEVMHERRSQSNNETEELLNRGTDYDVCSGLLALATHHYNSGHRQRAVTLLESVIDRYDASIVHYTSFMVNRDASYSTYPTSEMSFQQFAKRFVAFDVCFIPAEVDVAPYAVKIWLSCGKTACISPLVYALYLHFLVQFESGELTSCEQTLTTFEQVSLDRSKSGLFYVTAELLSHCCLLIGQHGKALKYLARACATHTDNECFGWFCSAIVWGIYQRTREFQKHGSEHHGTVSLT